MSLTALSELEIKVIQDLPKKPGTNLVLSALRKAWRNLLFESEVWRGEQVYDSVEDQATYTLTPPSDAEIKRIIKVELDDSKMNEAGYYLAGTNTLTFEDDYVPSESSTDGILIELAYNPTVNETAAIPSEVRWILNRFADGIVAGAQKELYGQRARPWYDPAMYGEKRAEFETAIGDAVVTRKQKRTTRKTGFSS